jgi:hypothetical protein
MWEITVTPAKNTVEAGLTIVAGTELIEIPFVVAPPIALSDGIDEKSFPAALGAYVSRRDDAEKGVYDPALQEYIFTANYLARGMI